jgi:CelD/BcsL family acetyltransferase involved in cellulose biosynthesis
MSQIYNRPVRDTIGAPVAGRSSGGTFAVGILDDSAAFADLEREWHDLYLDSPRATPFQSWAWLYSWWEVYGKGPKLRLVTVRDGEGLLVGLLPLMLKGRFGAGSLSFIGTGLTDHLDLLAREGHEARVVEAGIRALSEMRSWQVADLRDIHPGAVAWDLFDAWPSRRTAFWTENCPVTDVRPWDEIVGSLSKNQRRNARKSIRLVHEDGFGHEFADATEAREAARRLCGLHREAWEGRGTAPEHLDPKFDAFVEAAAARMTAYDVGGISEFRRGNKAVQSTFLVFGRHRVGYYLNGAARDSLDRYQYSSLTVWSALEAAHERGLSSLSYLRGEEPSKLRWSTSTEPNHRMILCRQGSGIAVWGFYAGYNAGRAKLAAYAGSESAPGWVRRIHSSYHGLRRKAARVLEKPLRRARGL